MINRDNKRSEEEKAEWSNSEGNSFEVSLGNIRVILCKLMRSAGGLTLDFGPWDQDQDHLAYSTWMAIYFTSSSHLTHISFTISEAEEMRQALSTAPLCLTSNWA